MLDHFFHSEHVLQRLRGGVWGAHLEDFAAYLFERGHSDQVGQKYLRAAGHFTHWLEREGTPPSALGAATLETFLRNHPQGCHCEVPRGEEPDHVRAAVRHLLAMLRRRGDVPEEEPEGSPIAVWLAAFDDYMQGMCGLATMTRLERVRRIGHFLRAKYGEGPVDFTRLVPQDVISYVSECAKQTKPLTSRQLATRLRAFLKFLQFKGLCDLKLVSAVPATPACRRLASLPKLLSDEQLHRLLGAFDRSTALGRRDYAIALCLVRLGLRAREVARLSLDHIDWRAGTIRIEASKGRRSHLLPLPEDVGRALAAYLRRSRPSRPTRQLFVRHSAPWDRPISALTIRSVIYRAHGRGQVEAVSRGTHALRHTAASRLLRAGATLKQIADILGHRSIDTTAIYAKVDVERLAQVALPWPGVQS